MGSDAKMHVYWLEQRASDVAATDSWLTTLELARFGTLRFPKRRAEWRLGRWTIKCAVAAYLKLAEFRDIEVSTAPSGAPRVKVKHEIAPVVISLSHRDSVAICGVAATGALLGLDVESVEPRIDSFITDYFVPEEQQLVMQSSAAARDRLITIIWSAKESALKALCVGLRADTRDVVVSDMEFSDAGCWHPLRIRTRNAETMNGWWQQAEGFVRTVVAVPPPSGPIRLQTALSRSGSIGGDVAHPVNRDE